MTRITITNPDAGPEVSHASRDVRFVFSSSRTVHERPASDDAEDDYAFHPKCGQRLPDGQKWGRVDEDSAEDIARKHPTLSFCSKCFTSSYRLRQIQREHHDRL